MKYIHTSFIYGKVILNAMKLSTHSTSAFALLPLAASAVPHGARTHHVRQTAAGLNAAMQRHGKFFGTFSDGKYLDDGVYTDIAGLRDEFEMLTPGNSMKWDTTEVC